MRFLVLRCVDELCCRFYSYRAHSGKFKWYPILRIGCSMECLMCHYREWHIPHSGCQGTIYIGTYFTRAQNAPSTFPSRATACCLVAVKLVVVWIASAWDLSLMLVQCRANVRDVGPALDQHLLLIALHACDFPHGSPHVSV